MNQNEFIRGKRLIDQVTGRTERDGEEDDDDKSEDSYENIERASYERKRSRTELNTSMVSETNS
jgi:hypothetical protein